jgi:hypothetical protein
MTPIKAMRTFRAAPVHAVKPPARRPIPRLRTGPAGVTLVLACVCAVMWAVAIPVQAAPPSPSPLATLPVVVAPTPRPTVAPHRPVATHTVPPTPLVLPVAPPAPRPAPVATSPPGAVQGIEAPTPGIPPPVAVLPTAAAPAGSASSVIPLGLLAAFVATLLIATGLTARRRL